MDERLAGYAAFERIRSDIEGGLIFWVERDDLRCPFRWGQSDKRADDDEGDDWRDDEPPRNAARAVRYT